MDEVLFQIETDKVTIDVRAPESGVLEDVLVGAVHAHACSQAHAAFLPPSSRTCPESLRAVQVKADDTVTVGQVIAKIAAGEGQPAEQAPAKQEQQAPAKQEPATPVPPADTGEPCDARQEDALRMCD